MIYGRGTVWVICSEQYDPKFFYFDNENHYWTNNLRDAKIFGDRQGVLSYFDGIKRHPEPFHLRPEELEYTSIIELELVQHWPDRHTEDDL
jgi:hypothetical protein